MPHNLFIHSSTIQTRAYPRNSSGRQVAIRWGTVDSNICLTLAFFVNAAILVLAAAAFHYGPHSNTSVADITTAFNLLAGAVGASAAPIVFAVALLCSGQQSTITGTFFWTSFVFMIHSSLCIFCCVA
jgi:manganese transport protein